jgi:hypothetical protein
MLGFLKRFLCLKIVVHQCQCFINDGRYPHIVYVEEPKDQDVEFSDAMIYEAKTTSEMEGEFQNFSWNEEIS